MIMGVSRRYGECATRRQRECVHIRRCSICQTIIDITQALIYQRTKAINYFRDDMSHCCVIPISMTAGSTIFFIFLVARIALYPRVKIRKPSHEKYLASKAIIEENIKTRMLPTAFIRQFLSCGSIFSKKNEHGLPKNKCPL